MPPKITLTMIVKDEEAHLPRCLDSVATHVDEIVIADTGSTDRTKEIAASYGAKVIDCNPETHPQFFFRDDEETLGPLGCPPPFSGQMCLGDFGGARNVSLGLATGDFILWLDADDVLENGQALGPLVEDMDQRGQETAWMRYLYGFDEGGRVTCKLWRERVIRRGSSSWTNPIHEVMVPIKPERATRIDHIVVRHHRPPERTAGVAQRNFKVLAQHLAKNPDDARTLFYFGNEARFIDPDKAIAAYERYVELSGWPEERAFARCCLGEMYEQKAAFGRAYANFAGSVVEPTNLPDGWFGLARLAYYKQDWAECCRLTEEGLKRGNPETVIMINPMARTLAPHMFYHDALAKLGRVEDAIESCAKGLEAVPDNPQLLHNLSILRVRIEGHGVRRPRIREIGHLDVVVWTGPSVEPWSPMSPSTTGIGGSETACIEVGRHLAALGHKVTVYGDLPPEHQAGGILADGVAYRHHAAFKGADCDVFISSRQPSIVDAPIKASLKLLWVHDVHVGQPNPQAHRWLLRFDRVLALTEWHRALLLQIYPHLHPSSVITTRNGIDPERFADKVVWPEGSSAIGGTYQLRAKRNKLIYSSSANRGLDVLLDVFPRIRAEVHDAELHVFYGFESWEATARLMNNQAELEQIQGYKKRLGEVEGVVARGRVDQWTLAREMMESKVWAYPTAFTETYGITAIEAQAAGCVPVTSDLAGLSETARFGVRLQGKNTDPEYQDAFVRETVAILRDDAKREAVAAAGRAWALTQSWRALAAEWSAMFESLIGELDRQVVPLYERMLGKRAA